MMPVSIVRVLAVALLVAIQAPSPFATQITALSEPGGYFDTDNLISNESSYAVRTAVHTRRRDTTLPGQGAAWLGTAKVSNMPVPLLWHTRSDRCHAVVLLAEGRSPGTRRLHRAPGEHCRRRCRVTARRPLPGHLAGECEAAHAAAAASMELRGRPDFPRFNADPDSLAGQVERLRGRSGMIMKAINWRAS